MVPMIRVMYCLFCGRQSRDELIENYAVYCKYCGQKCCTIHLWDMDPSIFENDQTRIVGWTQDMRINWQCPGCQDPRLSARYRDVRL